MKITELEKEERELRIRLDANVKQQKELRKEQFLASLEVKLLDKVQFIDGMKYKKGVFTRVDCTYSTPYCMVTLFNSNGKLGKRVMRVYNLKTLVKM